MKHLIFSVSLCLFNYLILAQQSCCVKPSATDQFAMLTQNQSFINTHLEPKPFNLESPSGKDINFKTPDGKTGHAYEIKTETESHLYVLIIHEWWGLNDYIKQEAERIYKTLGNVNVIALDLYDQKVASNRDSASKYMQNVKTERAEAIIKGALTYMGNQAEMATIGWCFGGGWSLQASLLAGQQCKACVMYYGMPEEKTEKLKTLNSPVLFVWPEQDQWINKKVVDAFENNMKQEKKSVEVLKYQADHAFANPSNPKYNKDLADDAYQHAIHFIKTYLRKSKD